MTDPTPEVEAVAVYAREASKALMALSGGGSEAFTRIGDQYYADPDWCVQRTREKFETLHRLLLRARKDHPNG